eukprot:gene9032-10702_t
MTTTTQLEPSVSGEDRQRTVSGGVGGMRELFSLRSQIIELDAEYQVNLLIIPLPIFLPALELANLLVATGVIIGL